MSIDFDTPLPPPREYNRLPEGDAHFEILDLKRNRRTIGKYGETPVADLVLSVTPAAGGGTQKLNVSVILNEDFIWKLYQFAAAVGQYEHGSGKAISIDWNKIPGSSGFCVLKHRAYKNKEGEDRIAVEIDKWLDAQGRAGSGDKPRKIEIADCQF